MGPWASLGVEAYGADAIEEPGLEDALYTLRTLVGVIARQTGETPRSVLESEFGHSPSDALWRRFVAP